MFCSWLNVKENIGVDVESVVGQIKKENEMERTEYKVDETDMLSVEMPRRTDVFVFKWKCAMANGAIGKGGGHD